MSRAAHGPRVEQHRRRRRPGTFGPDLDVYDIGDDPDERFDEEEVEPRETADAEFEVEPAPFVEIPASASEIAAAEIRALGAVAQALTTDVQAHYAAMRAADAAIAAARAAKQRRSAVALLLLLDN